MLNNFDETYTLYLHFLIFQQWDGTGSWNPCSCKARTFLSCGQFYGCWWPGDARSQGISSHGIDLVLEYSSISTRRVRYLLNCPNSCQSVCSLRPQLCSDLLQAPCMWCTWKCYMLWMGKCYCKYPCIWKILCVCFILSWGPFHQHELTSISAWISHYMPNKVCDEVTYPFPNFNGCSIEVWELINNFIPHFIMSWLFIHAGITVNPCL